MASTPFLQQRRLEEVLAEHQRFRSTVIPLCAAETPISEYVRSFMLDPIHESYAMGGPRKPATGNFVGSEFVLQLHQLTIELCRSLYAADYADPRPHSGTGAVTNLLMTLSSPGDRILLQTEASGGHASMRPICQRLGLEILEMPYDYSRYDVDTSAINRLDLEQVNYVLYAPSDVLYPSSLSDVQFAPNTTVILDLTQTLGLIASQHHPNPLDGGHTRTIVTGGTHKTLPGPTSGLILTNNATIADRIDSELSPKFVRHSHPHHMASLCATLIEHSAIGAAYSERILALSRELSACLETEGCRVLQDHERVSETHQVFVHIASNRLESAYGRLVAAGVTLNIKNKRLFEGSGLRFGTQDIARSCWTLADIGPLACLLSRLIHDDIAPAQAADEVRLLAKKNSLDPALCLPPSNAPQKTINRTD